LVAKGKLEIFKIFLLFLMQTGDGSNDDSVAINLSLQLAKFLERPLYFPAGSYIIKDTVNVGSK